MSKSPKRSRRKNGYRVGYGKPPEQHRFQPGKSGNPRGRPKVAPSLPELTARELARRRFIMVEGERVSVRTDELLIRNLIATAGQGKGSAANLIFQLAAVQYEKERRKNIEYKKMHPGITAQEAAELYRQALAQPSAYDLDERL